MSQLMIDTTQQHKAPIYAKALDEALQDDKFLTEPAATVNGASLTWSELRRKFLKHNPTRQLLVAAVDLDRATAIALRQQARINNFDADTSHEEDFGLASFPTAKDPTKGKLVRNIAYTPAIEAPQDEQVRKCFDALENALKEANDPTSTDSAISNLVLGCSAFHLANTSDVAVIDHFKKANAALETPSGYLEALFLRCWVIQGLLAERKDDKVAAIEAYSKAFQISQQNNRPSVDMCKWAEEASYRRALLSTVADPIRTCQYHAAYTSLSSLPFKHATLQRSYLTVLDSQPSPSYAEIQALQARVDSHLHRITKFPRAGDSNLLLLNFIDRVYESWLRFTVEERSGDIDLEDTRRVIDILESAQELTFHSHRILRHLTHCHLAIENIEMAYHTFELYAQLWEKAKETDLVNVSKQIRHFRTMDVSSSSAQEKEQFSEKENGVEVAKTVEAPTVAFSADAEAMDIDSDIHYIEMCCVGARLHCKFEHSRCTPTRALQLTARAGELLTNQKESATLLKLRAKVKRWEGIARGCSIFKDVDPETRPDNQKLALEALTESVRLDPDCFESLFHLAFVQAEQRKISLAISTIKSALQIDTTSMHAWHLLVLLVSADNDSNTDALQIANIALSESPASTHPSANRDVITPSSEDGPHMEHNLPNSDIHPEKLHITEPSKEEMQAARKRRLSVTHIDMSNDVSGFAHPTANEMPSGPHIKVFEEDEDEEAISVSSSSAVSEAESDRPDSSRDSILPDLNERIERFQLRITRNVLIEYIHGPRAALLDQQTLFSIFAKEFSSYIFETVHQGQQQITAAAGSRLPPAQASTITSQQLNGTLNSLNAPRRSLSIHSRTSLRSHVHSDRAVSPHGVAAPSLVHSSASVRSSPEPTGQNSILNNNNETDDTSIEIAPSEEIEDEFARAQHLRAVDLQVRLWLLAAATYRRSEDLEQAHQALDEASRINPNNPEIWVQLALCYVKHGKDKVALQCLEKASVFSLDYAPAIVYTAQLLMKQGLEFLGAAEGYLDVLTQTNGWYISEAWTALAEVYEETNRPARAKECLLYALQLQDSRPIRDLHLALPRVL